ncbi:akirin [Anopheles arabiensis]|uniref:AGAP006809-PA n=5 Tax=gambiae species complex TaxID=44542 RepID=Q7QIE8_ANOGA|nr:akirin [Anopheles arabiensis]XP_040175783.1 akirin [Anopheles arabiensis]XP_040175784.1 akirin [Anopheles arabiensis]XP_040175785.1 akirin [Anopheles arabiensis]XP_040175786.1 akirin [Anopheles arabiensis]XP_041773695.1 akirin-like isoform X5 [Anopheles merus]XP_041773696.1 akirin-like isoform X5 [Anopheles merus]XP_041773697.1 akirin-like isoform X5 [Anopheles merus]XP_041773698.1 akirin-like isoform X5 [Anopheles merus]XP_041773699.1 akirin-like isoform X5 [Anopheles merus]XP_0417737
MACATLKRSLDWESLNQRPTKRRRCHPFGSPSQTASASSSSASPSGSSSTSVAAAAAAASMRVMEPKPSPFAEATCSKLTPEKMAQNITEEIKRLHRRKQLTFNSHNFERMQDSESSGSEMGPDSPRRPDSPPSMVKNPEKALFTFKQVQMICERMLKEREDALREQYDAVLTTKLAEQYDAFVKFTYDQIQRRYEAAPSYLS